MSGSKSKTMLGLALLPGLALGACTVAPPTGPSITALPGPGKSFAQFQHDDYNCQGYANARMSGSAQAANAASKNANGTAVAGTLIGAAAGAALGALAGNAGAGAAIGAGAGLLGGASVAGGQAQSAADSMQGRYDTFYAQCMVGNGEVLQPPPAPAPVIYAPPPPVYYYAPY
jgi:Glycine-zipper domain